MNLSRDIADTIVKDKEIAVFWLGQAGFLLKDSNERIIVIDPYLTDCGERVRGFKRLTPKLITPSEIKADIYITTHIHFDHFDIDAIPLVSGCLKTKFFGPKTCVDKFKEVGIDKERVTLLEKGKEVICDGVMIKAVYADHGELAPDAIGVLLDITGNKFYFTGDTSYRPEKMTDMIKFNPDVAVLSVNGKFGNLNSKEGALVARDVKAKIAIPCHFWTFKEHGGDPQLFEDEMKNYAPNCQVKFMHQGEKFIFSK